MTQPSATDQIAQYVRDAEPLAQALENEIALHQANVDEVLVALALVLVATTGKLDRATFEEALSAHATIARQVRKAFEAEGEEKP